MSTLLYCIRNENDALIHRDSKYMCVQDMRYVEQIDGFGCVCIFIYMYTPHTEIIYLYYASVDDDFERSQNKKLGAKKKMMEGNYDICGSCISNITKFKANAVHVRILRSGYAEWEE